MQISATLTNRPGEHRVSVQTGGHQQPLAIPAKPEGPGSAVNGGELLFLALATCYCNDLYREAKERNIEVLSVHVDVTGNFGTKGMPAENIEYRVTARTDAGKQATLDLLRHTDTVAEIHNTLRKGMPVTLIECIVEE